MTILDVDRNHIIEACQMVLDALPGTGYRAVSASWTLVEDASVETISLAYTLGERAPTISPTSAPD